MQDWKYDHYIEQIRRTFHQKKNKKGYRVKKHENYVITALLHDEELRELKPITQHSVPLSDSSYALIDLYYPQIDLAIEVDEPHHLDNKDADAERQKRIEELIQCDFKRFDVAKGKVISDIKRVKKKMIKKMNALKAKGKFEEWKPIKNLDLDRAKKKFKNTLFIKVRGEFKPEEMYNRYRGRWPLAEAKLPYIKQIVIVHDRIVSKVFVDPVFKRFPEDNKFYFEAKEDNQNKIIGNNIANWEYQITWTYSEDVEEIYKFRRRKKNKK